MKETIKDGSNKMANTKLSIEELLQSLKNLVDTIWIITLETGRVEIIKNFIAKEWEKQEIDYSVLCDLYTRKYVYPADLDCWNENLSLEALKKMAFSSCKEKKFDIRFHNQELSFEWHETFLQVLKGEGETPERILLTSKYVNSYRKASIIEKAVEAEYDYIVYIEASRNSYVMYANNHQSGTPLPPIASNNFEEEVAMFHKKYVPEDQSESLTKKFHLSHVRSILQKQGEYVTYCKVMENGHMRDKKLRFSYFDKERDIWVLTRSDITEIREEKRQKKLLQDALNAATVANRAKSEFLSRMSHDIRTPMNAIIGMTTIAATHINNIERVMDCLKKIAMSSKLLLNLINEVLDMSKIESGSIVLSEEETNLPDILQSVVSLIQPLVDEKQHSFEVHVNQVKHEKVIGDVQRLQQVFLNILSNAIKYTPEKGHILLDIYEKPSGRRKVGCYKFIIEDNGIGMNSEFLERIFKPFERADDAAIRSIQGTGLGMSISKNIVEMMDGDIQVESVYGKGSRFTVTLFLRLQEETSSDTEVLANLPVLVVDDDEIVCINTCEKLNEVGMDSHYSLNGEDAVKKAVTAHETGNDYFAIIIDLRMPGMNGIETTRQIRNKVGPEIPIIMISAYDWSEYEDEAIDAGVNGFIMKPLFQSRLIYKLKQFALKEPECQSIKRSSLLPGSHEGKHILLVEDNELNREIAMELIASTGAIVETAENGEIAVEKMKESHEFYYDLILMDMQMPKMNGCEATMAIRKLRRKDAKSIPIVAMTANAFSEDMTKTRQAGMNEHMSKPIDVTILSETLNRWLE